VDPPRVYSDLTIAEVPLLARLGACLLHSHARGRFAGRLRRIEVSGAAVAALPLVCISPCIQFHAPFAMHSHVDDEYSSLCACMVLNTGDEGEKKTSPKIAESDRRGVFGLVVL
jgi:hypothetical protein